MRNNKSLLERYPRLIAHMICESLGYFTPTGACHALMAYKENKPHYCEWYLHMLDLTVGNRTITEEEERNIMIEIGRKVIQRAFRNRHGHKGYMADYGRARDIIKQELIGKHIQFASWF